MEKYPTVTLCGSVKFRDEFEQTRKELTSKGYIVNSLGLLGYGENDEFWTRMGKNAKPQIKKLLDDIHKSEINRTDSIFVVNPQKYIGRSTWSEICYARMIGKEIHSMEDISAAEIETTVHKHIEQAEKLAWEQLEAIKHSCNYYNMDNYVNFKHKGKMIVDPWINVAAHYDVMILPDHKAIDQAVNPFEYYGKEKTAFFIEEILLSQDE